MCWVQSVLKSASLIDADYRLHSTDGKYVTACHIPGAVVGAFLGIDTRRYLRSSPPLPFIMVCTFKELTIAFDITIVVGGRNMLVQGLAIYESQDGI
jgi:hypothetical protein